MKFNQYANDIVGEKGLVNFLIFRLAYMFFLFLLKAGQRSQMEKINIPSPLFFLRLVFASGNT